MSDPKTATRKTPFILLCDYVEKVAVRLLALEPHVQRVADLERRVAALEGKGNK